MNFDEKTFTPHCLFGLFTPTFRLLSRLAKGLESFENFSLTDAQPFEPLNVHTKKSHRKSFLRLSAKIHFSCFGNSSSVVKNEQNKMDEELSQLPSFGNGNFLRLIIIFRKTFFKSKIELEIAIDKNQISIE